MHRAGLYSAFSRLLFITSLSTLFLTGCGGDLYEKRLNNTIQLYNRYELRNASLSPAWDDGAGIRVRFPKPFKEIEGPKPPEPKTAEAGAEAPAEAEVPPPDKRLPENSMQLPMTLYGLRGAFVSESDGAFIFVMSSHGLKPKENQTKDVLLEEPGTDPKKLITDLQKSVSDALLVDFSPASFVPAQFPPSPVRFVTAIPYTQAIQRFTTPDNNFTRLFTLYCYKDAGNENIQVVIMTVEPETTAGASTKSLELGLETLQIDTAAFSGEAAAGGTGGGGGSAF